MDKPPTLSYRAVGVLLLCLGGLVAALGVFEQRAQAATRYLIEQMALGARPDQRFADAYATHLSGRASGLDLPPLYLHRYRSDQFKEATSTRLHHRLQQWMTAQVPPEYSTTFDRALRADQPYLYQTDSLLDRIACRGSEAPLRTATGRRLMNFLKRDNDLTALNQQWRWVEDLKNRPATRCDAFFLALRRERELHVQASPADTVAYLVDEERLHWLLQWVSRHQPVATAGGSVVHFALSDAVDFPFNRIVEERADGSLRVVLEDRQSSGMRALDRLLDARRDLQLSPYRAYGFWVEQVDWATGDVLHRDPLAFFYADAPVVHLSVVAEE